MLTLFIINPQKPTFQIQTSETGKVTVTSRPCCFTRI